MRIVARPCSWIRPGMLSRERALEHRREQRQDVDLEGHGVGRAGGVGAAVGVGGRRRCGGRLRVRAPRRLRAVGVGLARSPRSQVERLGVDDDLAATRREDPDEGADGRQVERAVRPAVDGEDLGLADPVDVLDRPELGAVDAAHGAADDLVPVVRAAGEVLVGPDDRLEVGAAQARRRRRASSTSRNRIRQPGPSATASAVAIVSGRSSPSR